MLMLRRTWQYFVIVAFLAPAAMADQIILSNGDRLTGSIIESDGTTIVVRSEFIGTVRISMDAVDRFSSDQSLHLTLQDNQTIVGTVSPAGDSVEVRTADAGVVTFPRQSIRVIRSQEGQALYQTELDRLRNPDLGDLWNGSTDVGFSLTRGNADTTTLSLGMNAARATTRDKISTYVTSLYAKNTLFGTSLTTANSIRGGARYDVNITDRAFTFGLGDLEFDEFQKLDLRAVVGGGLGWHVSKTERTTFDIFGGGALTKDYFSTGLKRTSGEIMAGQEWSYTLGARTSFKERAVIFPNLSETGEYRLNFDASLLTNLNTWLGWHITLSDRYLSNPIPGTRKNDTLLTTGLRVTFGR
jgi:putative salt-induced outer membrane protein YdiY